MTIKSSKTKKRPTTVKFGEHLIFDAYNCNPEKLDNEQICLEAVETMIKMAGMNKLMDPYIVKADQNETLGGKDPGGYSVFCMIQESHVSLHSFAKRGFVTIDLYSCKPFPSDGIIEYLKETFETEDVDLLKIQRGLKYPANNII